MHFRSTLQPVLLFRTIQCEQIGPQRAFEGHRKLEKHPSFLLKRTNSNPTLFSFHCLSCLAFLGWKKFPKNMQMKAQWHSLEQTAIAQFSRKAQNYKKNREDKSRDFFGKSPSSMRWLSNFENHEWRGIWIRTMKRINLVWATGNVKKICWSRARCTFF